MKPIDVLVIGVGVAVLGVWMLRSEPSVLSAPERLPSANEVPSASAASLGSSSDREAMLRAEVRSLETALQQARAQSDPVSTDALVPVSDAVREFQIQSVPAVRKALRSVEGAIKGARTGQNDAQAEYLESFRDRLKSLLRRVEDASSPDDVASIKSGPDATVLWNLKHKKTPTK